MTLIGLALFASAPLIAPALANPCPGMAPAAGKPVAGLVRYVVDGGGFCLSPSRKPETWVHVRLANYMPPELEEPGGQEAKAALSAIVRRKQAQCVITGRSFDRAVAACTVNGVDVVKTLRAQAARLPRPGPGR